MSAGKDAYQCSLRLRRLCKDVLGVGFGTSTPELEKILKLVSTRLTLRCKSEGILKDVIEKKEPPTWLTKEFLNEYMSNVENFVAAREMCTPDQAYHRYELVHREEHWRVTLEG